MAAILEDGDPEMVHRYVRDLQVLAGWVSGDHSRAEALLVDAVSRLGSPRSPAAHWTVRGLTVTALTRVAGARLESCADWDARLQQVWQARSPEDLRAAVVRAIAALGRCPEDAASHDHRALAALEYIRLHLQDPSLTLDAVSAAVRLSRWHTGRLLQRETGATYRELVRRMRLEHACALLREPATSVKEAAAAVGYRYSTELNRDFRRAFGASPTEWRRRATPRR
jgi:AraC-like DNA-binding protein